MFETEKFQLSNTNQLFIIIFPFQGGHGESENGGQETAGSGVDEQEEGGAKGIIDEEPEGGGVNEWGEGEADGTTDSGDEEIDAETTQGGGADEQGEDGGDNDEQHLGAFDRSIEEINPNATAEFVVGIKLPIPPALLRQMAASQALARTEKWIEIIKDYIGRINNINYLD